MNGDKKIPTFSCTDNERKIRREGLNEFMTYTPIDSRPTPIHRRHLVTIKTYRDFCNAKDDREKLNMLKDFIDDGLLKKVIEQVSDVLKTDMPLPEPSGFIRIEACEPNEAENRGVKGKYKIVFELESGESEEIKFSHKLYKIIYLAILFSKKFGMANITRSTLNNHSDLLIELHKLVYKKDGNDLADWYKNPARNKYKGSAKNDYPAMEKELDAMSLDFCKDNGDWRYFSILREGEGTKAKFTCLMPEERILVDNKLWIEVEKLFLDMENKK
jgi:hypothetical protein